MSHPFVGVVVKKANTAKDVSSSFANFLTTVAPYHSALERYDETIHLPIESIVHEHVAYSLLDSINDLAHVHKMVLEQVDSIAGTWKFVPFTYRQ